MLISITWHKSPRIEMKSSWPCKFHAFCPSSGPMLRGTPPPACFKINFNRATFAAKNKSGIEVVIRDSQGMVIASLSQLLPQTFQAVEVKALAAVRVLEFASELGIAQVVLKGDSKVVLNALAEVVRWMFLYLHMVF